MEKFRQEYIAGHKNIKIELVNQFTVLGPKEELYGTACPIMCVKSIVGQNNFLYISGDHFYSVDDLKQINTEHRAVK